MSPSAVTVHVVAAVIQNQDRVMVAQRRTGNLAGKWEFPGGKVRTGESPTEALRREIMEEFTVTIEVGSRIDEVPFSVKTTPYLLTAFFARYTAGAYRLRDHSRMEWIHPRDLATVDLAPADILIANAVRRILAGHDREVLETKFGEDDRGLVSCGHPVAEQSGGGKFHKPYREKTGGKS